jgi:cytidylate kinase
MARVKSEGRILRLIEHQATRWELRRRLRDEGSRGLVKEYPHLPEGPWVTISKSEGSLGVDVARLVARRLGWTAYDRELVETIARKAHVREKVLASLDERLVGDLHNYVALMAVRDYPGASVFVKKLMAVATTLGRHGKAVLVGRGAQFLLKPEYGVRVRIDADLDLRVRRYARQHRISRSEARRRVRRTDSQRAAWIRRYFHGELDDPRGYDLVINTGQVTPAQAAELVTRLVRLRFEDPE